MVRVREGRIEHYSDGRLVQLTASDIFSIVFDGISSINGANVDSNEFHQLGIEYSSLPLECFVRLYLVNQELPDGYGITCSILGRVYGREVDIRNTLACGIDYIIFCGVWYPIAQEVIQLSVDFLSAIGVSQFGQITLGQYLTAISTHDSILPVFDSTGEMLKSSTLSTRLKGKIPEGFIGKLYPYQEAGYNWLSYMRGQGLGCIIADEMGLGKTVQVICLLLEATGEKDSPALVITPATLLENWIREIQKFAPSIGVLVHRGPKRTGYASVFREYDVVLSSYETVVSDIGMFRSIEWKVCILDEAQAIKNPSAKRTKKIKQLRRKFAVAMSGTPFENHLLDVWSLSDYAIPSLLGNQSSFLAQYNDDIVSAIAVEPILTPIMLRRRVTEVAKDLPERIDIPQPLVLDDESANLYEAIRHEGEDKGDGLGLLVRLRLFCTHPWLIERHTPSRNLVESSVKLQRLVEILDEIKALDEKALIFTSFQESADIISSVVTDALGVWCCTIDGRMPVNQRQGLIDEFGSIKTTAVCILNPKAAGVGLNITAANHVIHFNLEWNPAVEDQASARAYRRGQTKPVTVHRFFYVDTVEEVINERLDRKRELASTAVVGHNGNESEADDIARALRMSPRNRHVGEN